MNEDILQQHIDDGEVSFSDAGYFCHICSVSLGLQPLPHLRGTNHNNALFLLTLRQPSRYRVRYNNIPEHIRAALQKGIIVAHEKKVVCSICDVSLAKEKSVKDHLLSSVHVMKVASKSSSANSLKEPVRPRRVDEQRQILSPSLQFDESSLGEEAPSTTIERTGFTVAEALRNGHIEMVSKGGIDGFLCKVCTDTNMITEDTPLRQHLAGRTHFMNVKKQELSHQSGAVTFPQSRNDHSLLQLSDGTALAQSRNVHSLPEIRGAVALPQQTSSYSPSTEPLPAQRQNSNSSHQYPQQTFQGRLQQNEFNHQRNLTHQQNPNYLQQNEFNNPQNSSYQQNPNYSQQNEFTYQRNSAHQQNLYQEQRSNQQQFNVLNSFPALNINVNVGYPRASNTTYDGSPFASHPASLNPFSTNYREPAVGACTTNPYPIDSLPRGIVVVFNYYFTGQSKLERNGAATDFRNVNRVFKEMGYDVLPENIDLTKQQTLDKLDKIKSCQQLREVDSFIAFFLSHGGDTPDEFRTVERKTISVEEIIYTKFIDSECPHLQGKPKLFFFNYCRGETEQIQSDSWKPDGKIGVAPKDVAVVHAALPHFEAKRHTTRGTLFIDSLCEVLTRDATHLDFHDIVLNTSTLMQKKEGTTATPSTIDFRKFYFVNQQTSS